jgi:hypothetical protein
MRVGLKDFPAQLFSASQIGAEQSSPAWRWGTARGISQRKMHVITDEPLQTVAWSWGHDWRK